MEGTIDTEEWHKDEFERWARIDGLEGDWEPYGPIHAAYPYHQYYCTTHPAEVAAAVAAYAAVAADPREGQEGNHEGVEWILWSGEGVLSARLPLQVDASPGNTVNECGFEACRGVSQHWESKESGSVERVRLDHTRRIADENYLFGLHPPVLEPYLNLSISEIRLHS